MEKIEEFKRFMLDEYNMINPVITFGGDYVFGNNSFKDNHYNKEQDLLLLNSKKDENGNNMYQSLIDRKLSYNFQHPSYQIILANNFYPMVVNTMDKDGKGRHLEFSLMMTILNLMEAKEVLQPIEEITEYNYAIACMDYYKELRNKMKSVLREKDKSPYYKEIKERFDISGKEMTDEVLSGHMDVIVKIKYIYLCLSDLAKNGVKISEQEFRNCFDPDKFILLYCKSILNNQPYIIKNQDRLDSSFVIVSQVMSALEQLDIKNYNPSIKVYDKEKRRTVEYTFRDLKKEYKKYYNMYAEELGKCSSISIDDVQELGLDHDNDTFEKYVKVLSEEQQKIIETEFEIIAKGETEKNVRQRKTSNGQPKPKKEIDPDQIIKRKLAFEKSNYVCQIVGKEKFNGYVGFIYENGYVVFERFYEDNGNPSNANATYIMTSDNFVEFIQKTKPEILEYIKQTDNPDIRRLYHTDNWSDNLHKVISSRKSTLESVVFAKTMSSENIKTKH